MSKIEKTEGIVTIAELLSGKEGYNGKVVTIKGEITKVNRAIMGKNWFHIQDGTDYEGGTTLLLQQPWMDRLEILLPSLARLFSTRISVMATSMIS
ncbi:MAG: hypothetical protein R2744_00190 [Bacteroidales bacterium]